MSMLVALRVVIILGVLCGSLAAVDPLLHLRCDGGAGEHAGLQRADEVPAAFIYDPRLRRSAVDGGSLRLSGTGTSLTLPIDAAAWRGVGSLTIECYLKPDGDPRRTALGVVKTRSSDQGAELGVAANYLTRWKQTYWSGLAAAPGAERQLWSTGHYVTISRLRAETLGWRHLAVVYDAEAGTASAYLDHWQVATRSVGDLRWDDGPLVIGEGFAGLVDEVRVTAAALEPHQFLRAVGSDLADVDFRGEETLLPRGTGYIDLKAGFGAIGDGVHDDTAAFQRALAVLPDKVPGAYYTLSIPPGTYLVSDMLHSSRFFVVQGAGRERTTIKLADNAKGFQDPSRPQPVWRMTSCGGPPGSNKRVNGSSIGLYAFDLTIDTGSGNPGAKGCEYHSNNHGTFARIDIRSGDGSGVVGLDLTHKTAGPSLIKDVSISGFDYGVTFQYQEYSMTMEHLRLSGQRTAGIHNQANIMALRGIVSDNRCPAIISEGGNSMITLLDSRLSGGAKDQAAIVAEGGLYARNVTVSGYGDSLRKRVYHWHGHKATPKDSWEDGPVLQGDIDEFIGDQVINPWDSTDATPLKLPIEETPTVPWGDIEQDWVSVMDFAELVVDGDWTPAIQAAVDSGARTVYFPQRAYEVHGTVTVGDGVDRLFGMRSDLRRPKGHTGDGPLLVSAGGKDQTLAIERFEVHGLHHRGAGRLVLLQTTARQLTNAAGCGDLFMEDTMSKDVVLEHPQRIWVRQWNPESHDTDRPCIELHGTTLWSLGFKTEYESSKLHAFDGARTEIYGGFIYPVVKGIPKDRPVFKNVDSQMALIYGQSIYTAGHDLQVFDQRGDEVKETRYADGKWAYSRFRVDCYISK